MRNRENQENKQGKSTGMALQIHVGENNTVPPLDKSVAAGFAPGRVHPHIDST